MTATYKVFKQSVKTITEYYMLLVDETKSQRLVGSTNEWVLDNYYMISEQEKVLRVDLTSRSFRSINAKRLSVIEQVLASFMQRCHFQVDKNLIFRYLSQLQKSQNDYLSYPEVFALLPMVKHILIRELATLCSQLRDEHAYHFTPTDKNNADVKQLDKAAQRNLLMMNIFNSLKKVTKLPVSEVIDAVSFSEKMLKAEKADMYDKMYDKTKDDYRAKIIRNCKKTKSREYDYVKSIVDASDADNKHVGWLLFPPKRWNARAHCYIWIVAAATLAAAALFALWTCGGLSWWTALLAVLLVVPVSQIVIDLFNRMLYRIHKPMGTFKIKFKDGLIPMEFATMVIMPTILKNKAKTIELLEQLEVYYLSNINRASEHADTDSKTSSRSFQRLENRPQNIFYTLIGDAAAYGEKEAPWDDEVAEAGMAKVKELNEKYGAPIFNFVYRRRAWSDGEQTWLGHERKRGAILHFNDLLLGDTSDAEREKRFRCETISQWRQGMVPDIQFVITLDTDTELVLYSAQKLIGAMAHPLNRATLSPDGRRVVSGYGIMQPRVNVDVEVTDKSRYAQLFAGLGGLDVYTTASFELYQDIFNEGSFCGKGIYDLRVFQQVLKGTFPDNIILSHDLIEGCYIRCGLINDIELFDDNPSNYIDDAKRHHRWTRGDWQIISWLRGTVRNEKGDKVKNQVNTIGKWKIFDNLRRSVLSLAVLVLLLASYALAAFNPAFTTSPAWFALVALLVVASPIVFFIFGQLAKLPSFGRRYHYYATLMRGFKVIIYRSIVQFAILPKEAWMYTDALCRACWRMTVSHKNLLNWVTSDEAAKSTKGTLGDYMSKFWFNYVCAAAIIILTAIAHASTATWIASAFCAALWTFAPLLMFWLGKKFPQDKKNLSDKEIDEVRTVARDTWHFFDSLLSAENNWLIPDNFQANREAKTDYKTSPTNIGYSLTAIISAARLGFISDANAVSRLNNIIATVRRLEKWNGHLFNWYNIKSLAKLPNYFVSTCDSGNFVACLYTVRGYLDTLPPSKETTSLACDVTRLITDTDFNVLYNSDLDVFSIGFDYGTQSLLPYHYNNFASEARLTSFLTIAQGDAPYKHWFCLDKTLVQYNGYKGVASWYGTLFEYFMPLIFLPTYKHTLMDETYSFAIRAQRSFISRTHFDKHSSDSMPWGISETAYNELDDAQNYKYHAFGVPYLKFQNTTPDRIVISPYSSLMTIGIDDRAVFDNIQRFKRLNMYSSHLDDNGTQHSFGFFESYDVEDDTPVLAHYAHHQGMILASLANYLDNNCLQHFFMQQPTMRSMETLLKEKAQIRPYIDLKVTQYKRYQYSKVQTESDACDFDNIAAVPEIGVVSNGLYTVLMNDRGSGFSRYRDINLNRYRKISADHYGTYLYIRDLRTDKVWSATYSPLDVMPENYHVSFASDKLLFQRTDGGIVTKTEVTVLKDRSAEIRRFTFSNNNAFDVDLELTSYGEVVLSTSREDENHRVFNAMKIASEYDSAHQALLFSRPGPNDSRLFLLHKLWAPAPDYIAERNVWPSLVEYETSRLNFIGRSNSLRHADIIESRRTLTGTVGTTLDPVMSMRRRIHVEAGKSVEAYILTGFAKARDQLLLLTEQYQNHMDIDHAFKTASVFNNIRTNLSLLKGSQMRLYNSINKYIVQTATLGTNRNATLSHNTLSQSSLWRFGISGDTAILLLEIDSARHSGFAKELLRAFEYFKVRDLFLDLVFINDAPVPERDGLSHFIRSMADTEHLWATHTEAGHVFIINGSDINDDERTLLHTVARLSFSTKDGLRLEQQLANLERSNQHYQDKVEYPALRPIKEFRVWSDLDFYNQYGGFGHRLSRDGAPSNQHPGYDYVVTNTNTPMPWINVIANPSPHTFGCIVSSSMAGFSFFHNAQQFKLTSWSNDIVRDNASEMLLINKQQFIPATARHGQGFSSFDADYDTMHVDVRLFVSIDKPEKYYHLRIFNKTDRPLPVKLDMVYKLVLGQCEEDTARYLYTVWDKDRNSLLVRNVYHPIYNDQVVQLTATEPLTDVALDSPNRKGIGLELSIAPQSASEMAFVISAGQLTPGHQVDNLSSCVANQRTIAEIYSEYDRVVDYWDDKLSVIQVETPDTSFNYMLNRWYLYQVYSSRLFARAGFYQVGGATGFRDQLQDVMSILYSDPLYARRQILDHAAHQFAEGDVLHWWHESMHLGARTTFSDDYLWLVFVTHQYVSVTGDISILSEHVPFCQADQLAHGEAERGMNYSLPQRNADGTYAANDHNFEYATLYEHLRRSIRRSMNRIGIHGLPLMGCGDWNDGMSRIGVQGNGESVWVALFLADLLPKMQHLTEITPDADLSYCDELSSFRSQLVDAIQHHAWDGNWFLRAYNDNGDPIGSRNNTECQIDLICQAWSILTDVASPDQKQLIMRETDNRLVNREHEIIQLLTPAFHESQPSPGYIMNYPQGIRENGGQYTHGAMWYIMAQLKENRNDMAYYLYSIINPIHRTQTIADVLKYKVEPFCIAADIYSNPQHPGRGGWTWYTGSASWAYKTGIENILGFCKNGDTITIDPHIPSEWPSFTIHYRFKSTNYTFIYSRPSPSSSPSPSPSPSSPTSPSSPFSLSSLSSLSSQASPSSQAHSQDSSHHPFVITLVDDSKDHTININ